MVCCGGAGLSAARDVYLGERVWRGGGPAQGRGCCCVRVREDAVSEEQHAQFCGRAERSGEKSCTKENLRQRQEGSRDIRGRGESLKFCLQLENAYLPLPTVGHCCLGLCFTCSGTVYHNPQIKLRLSRGALHGSLTNPIVARLCAGASLNRTQEITGDVQV